MAADINIRIGASIRELQKKLDEAERSMKRSGKKMSQMGNNLTMALSVPLAAFGAATLQAAGNFEASMNAMRAVTDGANENFTQLEETAKTLGATTQFSATEAAKGMEMLGRNGLSAAQILDGAAKSSLTLAAATGTDLSNAANIATDAMAQFNMKASDLAGVADTITGATVNSKFSIDDFQLAMASAGGVAGAVGVSFDDFAATISAISPSFASGADAGTSLKTMLTTLVPQSAQAAEMMKKLGIITADGSNQFFDAEGNMKSMGEIAGTLQTAFAGLSEAQAIQAAKTIFGTDAMRAGLKMAEIGQESFKGLKDSISSVAAEDVAETRMQGLNGAIMRLKSAFEAFQLAVADGGLTQFATSFVESLTGILTTLTQLDPKIFSSITAIAGLVIAIGPAIKIVGLMQLGYSNLIGAFNSIVGVVNKVNLAIQTLTVAELRNVAVVNAKNKVIGVYNRIYKIANGIVNAFRISTIKSTMATIAQRAATVAHNVAVAVSVGAIKGAIAMETAYIGVKNLLTGKIKLATIAQRAFNVMLMANPIGLIIAAIVGLIAAFVAAYQNIDWFRNFVDKATARIKKDFQMMVDGIKFVFMNFPIILKATWEAIKQFAKNFMSRFKRLALSAEEFKLRFQKALTFSKDKRSEIDKELKKIGANKDLLKENAKSIGETFNETLTKSIAANKAAEEAAEKNAKAAAKAAEEANAKAAKEAAAKAEEDAKKQAAAMQSNMAKFGTAQGFGGTPTDTKGEEEKVNSIRAANDALAKNTSLLKSNQQQMVKYNGQSSLAVDLNKGMARSAATFHDLQKKITEYRETREAKIIERINKLGMDGAAVYVRIKESLDQMLQGVKDLAESALQDMASALGEGIGGIMAGVSSTKDLGKVLLKQLAGVLEQLGQLAIKAGITMLGLQEMFKKGLAGGPATAALAIGAGIALVALSKYTSSKIDGMGGGDEPNNGKGIPALANGGIVSAPTLSLIGEAGPEAVIPLSKMNNMFNGSRNESVSVSFPMDRMVIALDRQRRRNSRVQ